MIRYTPNQTAARRAVSAKLVERFIFNFRLAPRALEDRLPVTWLKPQVIKGFSVVSFCILKVRRLMLWPVPSFLGLKTVSCAYRCGVIDISGTEREPSVYILGRNTDRRIIARLAPAIFLDPMSVIRGAITRKKGYVDIRASFPDGPRLFSARVKPAKCPSVLKSEVFGSLQEFVDFLKAGVSSYTPSVHDNRYARVDL